MEWGEFIDKRLESQWRVLIYGRSASGWNSIEKVKERFEMVRGLQSWDELEEQRMEIERRLNDRSVDSKTKNALREDLRIIWKGSHAGPSWETQT